jgi:hypothetical protein
MVVGHASRDSAPAASAFDGSTCAGAPIGNGNPAGASDISACGNAPSAEAPSAATLASVARALKARVQIALASGHAKTKYQ